MTAQTSIAGSNHIPPGRLWFGFSAGALAWLAQGFISVIISSQACSNGIGRLGPLSPPAVRLLMGTITVVLLAITVIGGMISARNWRQLSQHADLVHAEGRGRKDFMALLGVFGSIACFIGIVWAGIPLILLNVCVNAH